MSASLNVTRNSQEEKRGFFETIETLVHLDQDILESIFGVLMIFHNAARDSVNHVPVALDQFRKSRLISIPSERH